MNNLNGSFIKVGRHTYGFNNIDVRSWGEGAHLSIGNFSSIAANCTIFLGGNHRHDWITTFPFGHIALDSFPNPKGTMGLGHPTTNGCVNIGHDVWIGTGVTILSGVSVGNGAVIGCNSTVTKDVPAYSIYAGNPAKLIKYRFDEVMIKDLLDLRWWNLSDSQIAKIIPLLQSLPSTTTIQQIKQKISLPTTK